MKSIAALMALGCASLAFAQEYKAGSLLVAQPWMRATLIGVPNGAVYLKIKNKGKEPDALLSARNPDLASKIELNDHIHTNGVMRMETVSHIPIAPNDTTWLKPHGYHVMLIGLKKSLKEGDKVPLTLRFKKAGEINVNVKVEAINAEPAT